MILGLPELLEECLDLAKKLRLLIEDDREDMYRCIHGEVFEAYCSASKEAENLVGEIQKNLVILQAGQIPRM